jgi:hypothetical protein
MSKGMLGNLSLSDIRGPRDTLENLLAGDQGRTYLEALKKMIRGENPWPIVSHIEEGFEIVVGANHHAVTPRLLFNGITYEAQQILASEEFAVEPHIESVEMVLLHFDKDPELAHVIAEMERLKLKRPSYWDALAFAKRYPEVQQRRDVVFLHKPIRVAPDIGIGGADIAREPDGRHSMVLRLDSHTLTPRQLNAVDVRFLGEEYVYAARKKVHGSSAP